MLDLASRLRLLDVNLNFVALQRVRATSAGSYSVFFHTDASAAAQRRPSVWRFWWCWSAAQASTAKLDTLPG